MNPYTSLCFALGYSTAALTMTPTIIGDGLPEVNIANGYGQAWTSTFSTVSPSSFGGLKCSTPLTCARQSVTIWTLMSDFCCTDNCQSGFYGSDCNQGKPYCCCCHSC